MITRREFILVLMSACITAGLVAVAQPTRHLLGSTAVDWNSLEAKPTKTGFVRKVFESPTATLESLECHITTLNPGESPHPPHQHPKEELFIVKEGTVEALVNGVWKALGPGSVVFQSSNVPHSVRNAGKSPVTYHVLQWKTAATPKESTGQ
jgi:quercetin dioxygenase-like cupin family protein